MCLQLGEQPVDQGGHRRGDDDRVSIDAGGPGGHLDPNSVGTPRQRWKVGDGLRGDGCAQVIGSEAVQSFGEV